MLSGVRVWGLGLFYARFGAFVVFWEESPKSNKDYTFKLDI